VMISSMVLFFRREICGLGPDVEAPKAGAAAPPVAVPLAPAPAINPEAPDPAVWFKLEVGAAELAAGVPELAGAVVLGPKRPPRLGVDAAGAGVDVVVAALEVAFPKRDGVCAGADEAGVDAVAVVGFPKSVVAGAATGVDDPCGVEVLAAGVADPRLKVAAGFGASVAGADAGVELPAAGLAPNSPPAAGFGAAPPNKPPLDAAAEAPEKSPPAGADVVGVCAGCVVAAGFGAPKSPPVDCWPLNKLPVLAAGALFVGGGPAGVVDAKENGCLAGAGVVDPKAGADEALVPGVPNSPPVAPGAVLFNPPKRFPVGVAGLFSCPGVEAAPSAFGCPKAPNEGVVVAPPPKSPPPAVVVGVVVAAAFPKLKDG
jgi:hypothetical protein